MYSFFPRCFILFLFPYKLALHADTVLCYSNWPNVSYMEEVCTDFLIYCSLYLLALCIHHVSYATMQCFQNNWQPSLVLMMVQFVVMLCRLVPSLKMLLLNIFTYCDGFFCVLDGWRPAWMRSCPTPLNWRRAWGMGSTWENSPTFSPLRWCLQKESTTEISLATRLKDLFISSAA